MTEKQKRGFACMSLEQRRAIASLGGSAVSPGLRSFSKDPTLAREAGRKGGKASGGNFAKDRERAVSAGRKGGTISRRTAEPVVRKG